MKLPVVFIMKIINTAWVLVTRAAAGRALADRGKAYGIPGMQVDGMNVLAVREAGAEAMAYCRKERALHSGNANISLSWSFHV